MSRTSLSDAAILLCIGIFVGGVAVWFGFVPARSNVPEPRTHTCALTLTNTTTLQAGDRVIMAVQVARTNQIGNTNAPVQPRRRTHGR